MRGFCDYYPTPQIDLTRLSSDRRSPNVSARFSTFFAYFRFRREPRLARLCELLLKLGRRGGQTLFSGIIFQGSGARMPSLYRDLAATWRF